MDASKSYACSLAMRSASQIRPAEDFDRFFNARLVLAIETAGTQMSLQAEQAAGGGGGREKRPIAAQPPPIFVQEKQPALSN